MTPSTRSEKSSTPEPPASKNSPIQKEKDSENASKIAELEKDNKALKLEIENLKKKSLERLEKESKKLEAAKKIIDAQKKQIIEQVVDRTGIEDIKAENEQLKAENAALKLINEGRAPPAQPQEGPQVAFENFPFDQELFGPLLADINDLLQNRHQRRRNRQQ